MMYREMIVIGLYLLRCAHITIWNKRCLSQHCLSEMIGTSLVVSDRKCFEYTCSSWVISSLPNPDWLVLLLSLSFLDFQKILLQLILFLCLILGKYLFFFSEYHLSLIVRKVNNMYFQNYVYDLSLLIKCV